jgi:hypothetical protein
MDEMPAAALDGEAVRDLHAFADYRKERKVE